MKAARATLLARLSLRFQCSVPEVKAMSVREIEALVEALDEQQRAVEAATDKARRQRRT